VSERELLTGVAYGMCCAAWTGKFRQEAIKNTASTFVCLVFDLASGVCSSDTCVRACVRWVCLVLSWGVLDLASMLINFLPSFCRRRTRSLPHRSSSATLIRVWFVLFRDT